MTVKKFLLAAAMVAGMATGASAATLEGSSSGVFTSEDGWNVSASGNQLTWPGFAIVNPQSTLTIDAFTIPSTNVAIGNSTAQVAQLTWSNASSLPTFESTFGASADIILAFTSPSGVSGTEGFGLNITNTDNPSADGIVGLVLDGLFDFGSPLPLDLGQGVSVTGYFFAIASGDGTYSNGAWTLAEGGNSSLGLYANITAVPVPLPAAGFLMIAGIGGLAALRRRKKPSAA